MSEVLSTIKNGQLTYEQKVIALARHAEGTVTPLSIDSETQRLRDVGIICDLFEGNAPYRPRYILPDYEKLLKEGSEFLQLKPAQDIDDALNNLMIFYRHVPSITTFPVYIGNLDTLLEPYIDDETHALKAIKRFLTYIDRTITDSFCHANIGPKATKAGYLILQAERELQNSIPNLTMKYSKETPKEFAIEAIKTGLLTAKPSFANDEMFRADFNGDYGIASCYNGLNIAGGAYTLVRLNFGRLTNEVKTIEELYEAIPVVVKHMVNYMDERIKFLMEESNFFASNFLVREGFISDENFSAMFGMVGLANMVNHVTDYTYGKDPEATEIGETIIKMLETEVNKYTNDYLKASNGKYMLHAQVGIDSDIGIAPGTRIPIGEEPALYEQLAQAGVFHKYFPSGTGEIIKFDQTTEQNPEYVLNIIEGAFKKGMRYFSYYSENADVIRITGYLVKRSEIEKYERGEQVLRDTVELGHGAAKNQKVLERKLRHQEK